MATNNELEASIRMLANLSESELELELGRRLLQTAQEIERNESLSAARPTGSTIDKTSLQALPQFVRKTGERFLKMFNQQMYSLICEQTDPDHEKLRVAAMQGLEPLGYTLSGALIATFGWLPGIATVAGVMIAKRIAKSGYKAVCETWKERL
ncbi:MAG TPA: hypothetical protein VI685_21085 [Candidatus Angelobacter sp.]